MIICLSDILQARLKRAMTKLVRVTVKRKVKELGSCHSFEGWKGVRSIGSECGREKYSDCPVLSWNTNGAIRMHA